MDECNTVHVIDAMMGVGKTSSAINLINESTPDDKFMFITPYLTEVDRVLDSCRKKNFKQPAQSRGTKINGLKSLLAAGENIASTHALFYRMDAEAIELIRIHGYTLIVDEILDVVDALPITKHDLNNILACHAINENGMLRWTDDGYSGKYDDYKNLCELGCVGVYNDSALLWMFPASVFAAFREVYLLTYLFDGQIQKSYFDYHRVKYDYKYIGADYHIVDDIENATTPPPIGSVSVLQNAKLNTIGDGKNSLSYTWYHVNDGHEYVFKTIKNNTYNFFKNYAKTKSCDNLWTTFVDYKNHISGLGYANGFEAFNTRSTNRLREKTSVAYLINRFMMPNVKNFFHSVGIAFDEDQYALSEMIQFIWRSAIRDGKPIQVYIPSRRMRELFTNWLETFGKDAE